MSDNSSNKLKYTEESLTLVDYAGQWFTWVLAEGKNFTAWLDVAARFPSFSLNNQILVMAYKQDAESLISFKDVQEKGIQVKEDAKPIPIITPAKTEGGKLFYADWKYDAADTSEKDSYIKQYPDKLDALEAAVTGHLDHLSLVAEIDVTGAANKRAFYNKKDGKVYVKQSGTVKPDEFFTALCCEYVHRALAGAKEGYTRAQGQLSAIACAYAVGKRYGMDTGNINLSSLPAGYAGLSGDEAKDCLNEIRGHIQTAAADIDVALKNISERNKARNRERAVDSYGRI